MNSTIKFFSAGAVLVVALTIAGFGDAQTPSPNNRHPPMSHKRHQYYRQHPEEFQQLLQRLAQPVQNLPNAGPAIGQPASSGTWTSLANQPPRPLMNPVLLTDGTVLAHGSCSRSWFKLTPDNTGSYINGTWAQVALTASGYAPRFFGSGVLPDGRLVIEGGEYNGINCAANSGTTKGAIYDPVANTWTDIPPPPGWSEIADAAGIVLPNGTYMQTSCCDDAGVGGPHAALLNPNTLTWTNTGTGKADVYDEESMALLHDDTVLTVDAYVFIEAQCGTNSERYDPDTGVWMTAGSSIVQQSDCTGVVSDEVGPLVMRPDGTAVSFSGRTSGVPQTAIYNVANHSWAAGPIHPSLSGTPYTMADAPAAVLPNGNILVAMSPSNWPASDSFLGPTHYWELNIADNTFTQVADKADVSDPTGFGAYEHNLLVLPTGQIMDFTIDGPNTPNGNPSVQVYTANGTYQQSWRPVVSSVPAVLVPGATHTASGTQFSGLTEGAYYGDDVNASTNFPIVRITNTASGHVFYARTFGHSTRSIAPGRAGSTSFSVPASIEVGPSTIEVVANGIPSAPVSVHVSTTTASLQVSPSSNITASGIQGGPVSPASFSYTLGSDGTPVNYTISGVPTWLTASSVTGSTGTKVTLTVNASANSLAPGTYGPTTVSFSNTSNGQGDTTRTASLTVNAPAPTCGLSIAPSNIIAGQSATLTWNSVNATSGTITGIGTVTPSGSQAVTPAQTTAYSGSFTGPGGSANCATALTVNPAQTLLVASTGNVAVSGVPGGPFAPSTFSYRVSSSGGGNVDFAIGALPNWLTASPSSGTADTSGTNVTFTVNGNAAGLALGSVTPATIAFSNSTNGRGNTSRTATLYLNAACNRVSHLGDFNGDGRSDLMLRRADGALSVYLMNGFTIQSAQVVGTVGPEWTLLGFGDFNGDGKCDMTFRRADGTMSVFLMNGAAIGSAQILGTIGNEWTLQGIGDFNGDGKADLLFRRADGTLSLFLMDGLTIASAQILGSIGTEWTLAGVADFNGDGRTDILMRRADGTLSLYLMNGFTIASAQVIGQIGSEWTLQRLGDLNGDGRADMLFRRSDGTSSLYLMDGFNILGSQTLGQNGPEWTLRGLGDFNADGKADMLFRRPDGTVAIYLMDGPNIVDAKIIGAIGTEWNCCFAPGP